MRVVKSASLSDADRDLIVEANRGRREILVAATAATVDDNLGPSGERGSGQYVGIPQDWAKETLTLGPFSGSYSTTIPWEAIRGVWLLEDAPATPDVEAML